MRWRWTPNAALGCSGPLHGATTAQSALMRSGTLPPVLRIGGRSNALRTAKLCALPNIGEIALSLRSPSGRQYIDRMAVAVLPMTGAEYLTAAVLADSGKAWMRRSMPGGRSQSVQEFSSSANPPKLVGHFNWRKPEDEGHHSRFWRPTRGFRRRLLRSICCSARPCRNTRVRRAASACFRC